MLAHIDHADPARSAEQAADAAADAAGVQLSERFSIVQTWCPEAKRLRPARPSGEKLLDDFHRSRCSIIHAYLANTAAAVHASGTCSAHEASLLKSAAAAAAAAAEDPLDSELQASFLSCVTAVRAMSRALLEEDAPAHDAALKLAVAQQRGKSPPPPGQIALQIHEASRAAWASHVQWERTWRAFCDDDEWDEWRHQIGIINSHGLRCCPLCGSRLQHPLSVGFVLDNATCWCHGPCQRPWLVWAMHRWLRGPMRVRSVPRSRTNCVVLRFLLYLLRARRGLHRLLEVHGIRRRSLWTYGPSYGT